MKITRYCTFCGHPEIQHRRGVNLPYCMDCNYDGIHGFVW